MPYYVVDRIEDKIAVLVADNGAAVDVPRRNLPIGVREGSVLQVLAREDGSLDWSSAELDEAEGERRLKRAREMLERMRRRDPGGDVTL